MNQRPKQPELILVSLVWSIPRSILLLPLGWDASPSQGHPPAVCCRYPFIHRVKTTRRTKLELQTSRSGVWSVDLLATRASFMMILSVKTSNVTNNPTQKYTFVYDHGTCLCCTGQLPVTIMYIPCGKYCSAFWQLWTYLLRICVISSKLCSSNAWWPMAPNFCSWATRKNFFLHRNHVLGTLDIRALGSLQFYIEHSLVHVHVSVLVKKKTSFSPNPCLESPEQIMELWCVLRPLFCWFNYLWSINLLPRYMTNMAKGTITEYLKLSFAHSKSSLHVNTWFPFICL